MKLVFVSLCFLLSACASFTPTTNDSADATNRKPDSQPMTDIKNMQTILRCGSSDGYRSEFNVGKVADQIYIYSPSNHFVDEIQDAPNVGFATESGIARGLIKSEQVLTGTFKFIRKNENELNEEWALSFTKPGIGFREPSPPSIPFYDVRIFLQNPEDGPSKVIMQDRGSRIQTHVCCPGNMQLKKLNGYQTCQKAQ